MSIIHDALKKVQSSLTKSTQPPTNELPVTHQDVAQAQAPAPEANYIYAPPVATPPAQTAESQVNHQLQQKNQASWIVVLAVLVSLGCGYYLFLQLQTSLPQIKSWATSMTQKARRSMSQAKALSRQPTATTNNAEAKTAAAPLNPSTQNAATVISPPPPAITLQIQGVMANSTGNVALINDRIYQAGDQINNIKITKINLDAVVVMNNGVEETIKVGK